MTCDCTSANAVDEVVVTGGDDSLTSLEDLFISTRGVLYVYELHRMMA